MPEQELEILDIPHGEIIDMNQSDTQVDHKEVPSGKKNRKKSFLVTLSLIVISIITCFIWTKISNKK